MDFIEVKRFSINARVPQKMSPGAAGFDLYALQDEEIGPRSSFYIRTGVNVYVPPGYYGAIKGRSGNAFLRNMFVFNDVINSGYQEEITLLIMNFNNSATLHVKAGERVAQIILTKIHPAHHVRENVENTGKDLTADITVAPNTPKTPPAVDRETTATANEDTQELYQNSDDSE